MNGAGTKQVAGDSGRVGIELSTPRDPASSVEVVNAKWEAVVCSLQRVLSIGIPSFIDSLFRSLAAWFCVSAGYI